MALPPGRILQVGGRSREGPTPGRAEPTACGHAWSRAPRGFVPEPSHPPVGTVAEAVADVPLERKSLVGRKRSHVALAEVRCHDAGMDAHIFCDLTDGIDGARSVEPKSLDGLAP